LTAIRGVRNILSFPVFAKVINYTQRIQRLMHDVVTRTPSLSFIDLREVLDHFNQGRTLLISEMASDDEVLNEFRSVSGLLEAASSGRLEVESRASSIVSCELLLEGLYALKKIARSEARGATNYTQARPERPARGAHYDDWTGGKVN